MQNQRRPLYFIHIPKAGGTTLISVLDRYYSHDEIFPAQLWRELVRIPQEGIKNYRVFRGHFGAEGLDPFLPPDTAKITFLRHPTALSYSRYRFIQREPGSRVHRHARNVSFKEFLDNPRTRSRIANKQVRALSFSISHVAGVGPIFPYPVPRKKVDDWLSRRRQRMNPKKAYVRAIASLEKCAFHGIVERYDESLALLSYTLDLPPVGAVQALRMVNRPSDIDALKISERRLVEEYNHWDLELYERAKKEFDSRFAAMLLLRQYKRRHQAAYYSANIKGDIKQLNSLWDGESKDLMAWRRIPSSAYRPGSRASRLSMPE